MKQFLAPLALVAIGLCLFTYSFFEGKGDGRLKLDIEKTAFVMPAAHKVYANPDALDGRYYLFKAKLKNESRKVYEDVTVRYRIPGYVDWTELSTAGELLPGQTLVAACYPKFDESITEKMTASTEKAELEISWDDMNEDDLIEADVGFQIVGRNTFVYTSIPPSEISGWADTRANVVLMPCFVTPNDPVLKYYAQLIREKVMQGEAAMFSNDPKDAITFLKGIYEATVRTHMVYSGAQGIPRSYDDQESFSQDMRLPREVITGNTGLCIELSFLYASICSAAGLEPVIFLVPGHAYPGIRFQGQYYVIETTSIGGEGLGKIATAQEAFEAGMKQLKEFFPAMQQGDPRYALIDINQLYAQGVTPMSLRDDDFLKGKLDELAKKMEKPVGQPEQVLVAHEQGAPQTQVVGPNQNSTIPAQAPASPYSIPVPQGWTARDRPNMAVPILTAQIFSPDQTISASVFDVPVSNLGEALNQIQWYLGSQGMEVSYQIQGDQIMGVTSSMNGHFNWVGKAVPLQGGLRVVAIGSPIQFYDRNYQTISQLLSSVR